MSIHDSNDNTIPLSNYLWQEKIDRENQANWDWMENFYSEHPEFEPPEMMKHRYDSDYWKVKPCWKSFLQGAVFFLTGIIIFPNLWEEQHPQHTKDKSTS